jgi:3-methylcrotonyl-CoA carboxylase beta subunit
MELQAQLNQFCVLSTRIFVGGARGFERHVVKNKKILIRERIKMLIDPGTYFLELGHLVGYEMTYGDIPAGGLVTGTYP